eukprot:CAMPEP_0113890484 /NCGR_PEP_ID=MMETSP0780_2-20120614/14167_1 /TAXON_ID=652834 /ORGANISM="Palpitomonas bilix" /LENGTH=53 /DNA_ID=CAMNT_0000879877 /DNA_START=288 /DNA_END=449 /DNA_ORIENTATION=- /assembly_acc=CAM_ASM_000599
MELTQRSPVQDPVKYMDEEVQAAPAALPMKATYLPFWMAVPLVRQQHILEEHP